MRGVEGRRQSFIKRNQLLKFHNAFFSQIMQDRFGEKITVELCPGGRDKEVDNVNK